MYVGSILVTVPTTWRRSATFPSLRNDVMLTTTVFPRSERALDSFSSGSPSPPIAAKSKTRFVEVTTSWGAQVRGVDALTALGCHGRRRRWGPVARVR
jgi:hypothetical protein